MVQLPRFVALKSKYNHNYLRHVKEVSKAEPFDLRYSGDEVLTSYTKFEIEQAKCDSSLVHIRCCYNNKYFVISFPSFQSIIIAGANQKEEDKSKWTCTLFQPIYDSDYDAFRFRHVYFGYYVYSWIFDGPYKNCLVAKQSSSSGDISNFHSITDWESLLSLPKYVAFKGNNGCYLRSSLVHGRQFLEFSSGDIGDPAVAMESIITKDGSIRLKSNHLGMFWRRDNFDWILADSTDTTDQNSDTLFWPIKVKSNIVALRNFGNYKFVKRLTVDTKTSCLSAAVDTIDQYSKLEISEAVLSREIYNVNFRLSNARIFDQSVLVMATGNATNRTSASNTLNLNLSYSDTKSSKWGSSISIKLGVSTTLETGIPFVADGKVEISAEFSGTYEWERTETSSKTIQTTYEVTVPPMSSVVVSLLATKGKSEVPYSYTQRDTLMNGQIVISTMDDGVYHGINCYNFTYETKTRPL